MQKREIKAIAKKIVAMYWHDLHFQVNVDLSNEPYRAMHCESGLADMIEDGSDDYVTLVDYLEDLIQTEPAYIP
jgi:hypothetical protein